MVPRVKLRLPTDVDNLNRTQHVMIVTDKLSTHFAILDRNKPVQHRLRLLERQIVEEATEQHLPLHVVVGILKFDESNLTIKFN